jgi:glycosyltransferase involved in cell wall biosynthesis
MHVAINAYFWNHAHTGSGQYLRQLVYHLNRLVSDLETTLVYPRLPGSQPAQNVPPSVRVREIPIRGGHVGKVLFEQIGFPRACRQAGATIAHVPYWGPALRSALPQVTTVHDLTTVIVREYRRGGRARLYNALVSAAARGADAVITDSQASKEDIIRHLQVPAERITPIYLAAGSQYTPEAELLMDLAIRRKYDLPESYVLYLGGFDVHKNVSTLLLAYTYVAQAMGDAYPLVLAGRKPTAGQGHTPDYPAYIEQLRLTDQVRWIGFVDEEDKPALYRGAECFVFPSRYEGFGLPPLEAMACGVPAVTTDAASLPEVVGDAAFAVSPDAERDMAGAIIAILVQEHLAAEMRQKGLAQAARFSWENTATETLLVYDRLARKLQR